MPGGRGIGSEARAANEMRILGMNQPFPAIFGGEDVRVHLLRPPCSVNAPQLLCPLLLLCEDWYPWHRKTLGLPKHMPPSSLDDASPLWCQAAGAGEYWMITADPGQRGFATGPRSIVLQAPNAGSLIDFSAGVLQAPGGNAGTSNWSDDGQLPSAMESTQLAGEHP